MPTYDYDCQACGNTFELFQSMSEPPADKCPECGGLVRRRIHGGAGLIFKGSGFYLTDYKKSGKKDESDPKPAAGKENAKSDNGKASGEKTEGKNTNDTAKKSSQ